MSFGLLRVSEAASIALHTTVFLASDAKGMVSVKQIASRLKVSEAHLSKVLQRLAKAGVVRSARGPKGGFVLNRPAGKITLLEVYEAIEGPLRPTKCLLNKPICRGDKCVLGGLLKKVNQQTRDYLARTSLSEFKDIFTGGADAIASDH